MPITPLVEDLESDHTLIAIAAGIGAQVALEVLSNWADRRTHVHDTP